MRKEFIPGKLKPEYTLMNKIIHNMIGPKGKEKLVPVPLSFFFFFFLKQ